MSEDRKLASIIPCGEIDKFTTFCICIIDFQIIIVYAIIR